MRTLALTLLLLASACAQEPVQTAMSRGLCGDSKTVGAALAGAGETPEGIGVDRQSGELFQLLVGPNGWSFISANRFGASCMIASGQEWRAAK